MRFFKVLVPFGELVEGDVICISALHRGVVKIATPTEKTKHYPYIFNGRRESDIFVNEYVTRLDNRSLLKLRPHISKEVLEGCTNLDYAVIVTNVGYNKRRYGVTSIKMARYAGKPILYTGSFEACRLNADILQNNDGR